MSEHPFAGRITTLEHHDLVFDVVDEGPIDGEAVVLLHGFPERSTCWRDVAPLLHAAGYRTVAMDQRGYSRRARPTGGRRDYRLELLAGDAAALLMRVGGGRPVHLVGHDWGAIVAWATTQTRPDLVRTLTAVSVPHPAAFLASMTRSTQALKSWYMAFFNLPRAAEALAAKQGGLFDTLLRRTGMTREDVERVHREVVDTGALPGALGYYRALPFLDRKASGRPVRVPTTMVWSDGDTALDRKGAEATAEHVDAPYELVVLTGVSHWIPTQAPQALAEAIVARAGSV